MMRANAAAITLGAMLAATSAWAQGNPQSQVVSSTERVSEATSPDYTAVYCSSFISSEKAPDSMYIASGEQSNDKIFFSRGDYIYLSRGSAQGVKVGDRFDVIRPEVDPDKVQWFKWQSKLAKAMGTFYRDTGQIKVINVQSNTSTAQIVHSCSYMQRGDIVRPYVDRPSPPYKPAEKFDHFAPVSGKPVGMLVIGPEFTEAYGKNSLVYVNLGNNQGVKMGDYLRIFRYQGSMAETAPNTAGYAYKLFGFGSTPRRYEWNDLPREILGEGVVINVSPNSCTMFVTYTTIDVYAGDYAEIE
jgi:hypothetical protein